jgi:acyl phosphate:glycerol-3-phosphate acyltransferase
MKRPLMAWLAALAGAYLIGSVPSGFVIARLSGVADIRLVGSGNIGATNVMRTLGWKHGLVVLALDAAKGSLGVLLLRWLHGGPTAQTLGGLAAMVGHLWPCTLRFQGGRGVATGLGLMAMLSPLAACVGGGVFVVVVALTRYVSLGSMAAASSAVAALMLRRAPFTQVVLCALGAGVIIWRHRPNIARLRAGTERRFTFKRATRA